MKRLQRRFSPRRIRLGSQANQVLEGGEGKDLTCIVGRELCLFTTVDAHKVPDKQRNDFVALAVKRAAPFPDPAHGVAWTAGHHAAVWYWSRSRVQGLLDPAQSASRLSFQPEGLYTGQRADATGEQVQLLALTEGVEARAWRHGRLLASRWWPAPPASAQWQAFLRSAGVTDPALAEVPEPLPAPVAALPWTAVRSRRQLPSVSGMDAYLPKVLLAVGVLALAVYGFQVGSLVRNHVDAWNADRKAANLDAPLQRILDARSAADANAAAVDAMLALRSARPQHEVMAEAAKLLPGNDWVLRRWHQPATDRLELTLEMPGANPEQLVASWEASPVFRAVTADLQPSSGVLTLRASIEPARAGGTP